MNRYKYLILVICILNYNSTAQSFSNYVKKKNTTNVARIDYNANPNFVLSNDLFYIHGNAVLSFFSDNLDIAVSLSSDRQYNNYYILDITIQNKSTNNIDINPKNIYGYIIRKGKADVADVLSHSQFMKTIKHSQNWQAFGKAFSEYREANNAGKSTTNTRSSSYGNYIGSSRTNYQNQYGNNLGHSNTIGNILGHSTTNSTTQTENGAVKYLAKQNAKQNVEALKNKQSKIRNILNQGYLKRHTLRPQETIRGNVNITYSKSDRVEIIIPINGKEYVFIWDKETK